MYKDRTIVSELQGGGTLWTLPTEIDSVITFAGSFEIPVDYLKGDEIIADMAVALLDKGSRGSDKYEISERLQQSGAEFRISYDMGRISFRIRCTRSHFSELAALVGDLIREPVFPDEEIELVKTQTQAALLRATTNTAILSDLYLRRHLFEPSSPSYAKTPTDQIEATMALSREDIAAYYFDSVARRDLKLVAVGDVPENTAEILDSAFSGMPLLDSAREVLHNRSEPATAPVHTVVTGKRNVDVRAGHCVALTRDSVDFVALYVAVHALGGNFSSRLMDVIRDERGLTYSIAATISDITIWNEGFLSIRTAFTDGSVVKGIQAIQDVVSDFWINGLSDPELERRKKMLAGSYLVGLSTTSGLAASLKANAERGFDPGYLDRFPKMIGELTLSDVNETVQKYVEPDRLQFSLAGETQEEITPRALSPSG